MMARGDSLSTDYYAAIRPADNKDCPAIIELIDGVLREWNDAVCLDDSEQDLVDIEEYYWAKGGAFVVLELDNRIIGSHGILPLDRSNGLCTYKRLYLSADFRGSSAGHDLMRWNIDWSIENGFRRIEFWSDSRFHRAHRFFEKFGFSRQGEPREMNDSHETYWEYQFAKTLS